MPKENLYFVALIPHDTIAGEVTGFKNDFADNYNSSKALRSMPHITLKAPFKLLAREHKNLMEWFTGIRPVVEPFVVELQDFGSFPNKDNPVIYVKPVMTPSLERLQKAILTSFEHAYPEISIPYTERNFHPHMTIAYRDLTPEQYERAMDAYQHKKYSASFRADKFHLLQHDGERWSVVAEHIL
ncbi:2'-5' RNA ligase family protein [Flavobacterium sp. DG1-102-2]|uniref:2'-5' RNA ligase family protein n=1 Tax=Flavobacterium sp. DG1-102-2 TaxID=3081663 RepID=UPI00294A8684|nr:2'-5' RNA ligase family protein [Flavobacterium sp. DG1-102-2]MDV6169175.1 2'-5' RNA ligase family protein [Flavobacterium sp. DG1-102-2]